MRLIGPLLFALVGVLVGLLVRRLLRPRDDSARRGASAAESAIAGVLGAFVGLWVPGLLDLVAPGPLNGALVATVAGATAGSVVVNLALWRRPS